jgi:hypothetical protein
METHGGLVTTPLLRQLEAPALGQFADVDRVAQIEAVRLQEGPEGPRRIEHRPEVVVVHAAEPEQGPTEGSEGISCPPIDYSAGSRPRVKRTASQSTAQPKCRRKVRCSSG